MLGPNEGWLYITIINLIYSHGAAIDADLKWLGKVANMHGNAVRAALKRLTDLGKVFETNGKLMAKRCETELETARKRAVSSSDNGGKGGRPRNKTNDVEEPTGSVGQKATNTNTNTKVGSTEPDGSSEPTEKKRALTRDELFAAWWQTYPHKVGKGAARAKFDIAVRNGATLRDLILGVERYVLAKSADVNWVNPARWLYEKRWLDEPAPTLVPESDQGKPPTEAERWWARLNHLRAKGDWYPDRWGPPPSDPACQAPLDLLIEFGHRPKEAAA